MSGKVNKVDEDNNWLDIGAKFRRRAMLWWPNGTAQRVLIVKKPGEPAALEMLVRMATWCALLRTVPFCLHGEATLYDCKTVRGPFSCLCWPGCTCSPDAAQSDC